MGREKMEVEFANYTVPSLPGHITYRAYGANLKIYPFGKPDDLLKIIISNLWQLSLAKGARAPSVIFSVLCVHSSAHSSRGRTCHDAVGRLLRHQRGLGATTTTVWPDEKQDPFARRI